MSEFRIEEDTLGEVKIPKTALWGPQTERSRIFQQDALCQLK